MKLRHGEMQGVLHLRFREEKKNYNGFVDSRRNRCVYVSCEEGEVVGEVLRQVWVSFSFEGSFRWAQENDMNPLDRGQCIFCMAVRRHNLDGADGTPNMLNCERFFCASSRVLSAS